MGSDLKKKPVYLEFYGLPGCGKSTISHLVAEELRKQGKTVSEPTYDMDHSKKSLNRKSIKVVELVRLLITHPKQAIQLYHCMVQCDCLLKERAIQMINIAYKINAINNKNSQFIVLDEGLTQSAISITINKQLRSSMVEEKLYRFYSAQMKNVLKIYIRIPIKEALRRMAVREKHDSRIERISNKKEKIRALNQFYNECEIIERDFVLDNLELDKTINEILMRISYFKGGKHENTILH